MFTFLSSSVQDGRISLLRGWTWIKFIFHIYSSCLLNLFAHLRLTLAIDSQISLISIYCFYYVLLRLPVLHFCVYPVSLDWITQMQCSKSWTPGPDQNCKKFKLQRPDVLQGQNCTIIQPLSFCFFIGGYWNSKSSVIHLSLFLRSFTGSQHHSHRACKFASSCANTTFREIKISSLISRLNKTIRK